MVLHTGEPKVGQERYVGIGVHRAARIGAAGHGGQVLLSWTTKGLAEEDLPPGISIRDLGERRLKDIEQPQHLYQLVIEGLESEFGPQNTLDLELRRKRRRMYAGSALIGVIAAAVAIPVFALGQGGSGSGVAVEGNAVAVIDPQSNRVTEEIPVGARPGALSFGSGSLWVANLDDQSVSRVDPDTRSVTRTLPVVDNPTGLAATAGSVWVVGSDPTKASVNVRRIDPEFDTVARQVKQIGNVAPGGPGSAVALGNTVWIARSSGLLSRVDPVTSRVVHAIDPNSGPGAVALGAGAVWVADSEANTVTRIDPTGLLTPIPVGLGPSAIAVGYSGVWVADSLDDAVVRIDPRSRAVTTTIPVGQAPTGVAVGAGSIWVANSGDGTVTRIDPVGGRKPETIPVGGSPQSLVVAQGRVWVTVDQRPVGSTSAADSGGTVRLSDQQDIDYVDPALAFIPDSWQLLYAACAQLVNYPDKPAPAGSQLKPEVAEALPKRSADGRTYTFTIRDGFRFSPPSNEPVSAQTFKYTIERTLSPTMKSPAQGYMHDVAGANAYMSGKATHITGVVAHGDKLVVRLVAPAPDVTTRLGLPFFCAVPIGTPIDPKGVRTIPSAGPYYVASYVPKQGVVLKRNPNYTGSRPHRPEQIALTVGVSPRKIVAQTQAGRVDFTLQGLAPTEIRRTASRYGPDSPAARKGKQQYFVNPAMGVDFLWLNLHRPLFSDARLRRAVNYAVDRRQLARIGNAFTGVPEIPSDQYLPPGMPGFTDARIYPFSPDVSTAKRLAGEQRRTAVLYTCNMSSCAQPAQVVKTNLAAIGIDVQVKAFPVQTLFARVGRKDEPYDLALLGGWLADYADPDDFLNFLIGTGAGGSLPGLAFDDPAYQRKIGAASQLAGPPRYLAYGKLDAETARRDAPSVALGNHTALDFFSARMGCQVYQPVYGMDLAALCIRH
jgi:peptide/nickel transport system substrate-binding protein